MNKPSTDSNLDLTGQLLIAMPDMSDPRFARSVVYMCSHSDDGAMGLIVNKQIVDLDLEQLLGQIDIAAGDSDEPLITAANLGRPVHNGGPVEAHRGFVLHSPDYFSTTASLRIADDICLTATTDILTAIASGAGPHHALLALGYAGWSPGQLEAEIAANAWLTCPGDTLVVFADDNATKYSLALGKLGIEPSHLVSSAGRA
jgi:putative transcriptional regulator